MYVEINNTTYRIKFHRQENMTFAELFVVESTGRLTFTGLDGVALCSPEDVFEKSMGRKVALADLLEKMRRAFSTIAGYTISKEDRKSIWTEYFRTHRK